jgi:predicted nucleic acid-binding protein
VALGPRYLPDKSALARLRHPAVAARMAPLAATGQLATCGVVDLEVLYSARDGEEHRLVRRDRRLGYARIPIEEADFERAIAVQGVLAERGLHRAVAIPDLLIAAVAERAGLAVLHYDHDYERIAAVTDQAQEWVVEPGTVP